MFGIDSGEILIIAIVALLVIGPKDLPRVMRAIGNFIGQARGMARHFRTGFDAMIREAELDDMEKKWRSENERIMREFPGGGEKDWAKPPAVPPATGGTGATMPASAAPPIPPAGAGTGKDEEPAGEAR